MFFKNQGHNEFWQQIQGQSLALKDVWQPYHERKKTLPWILLKNVCMQARNILTNWSPNPYISDGRQQDPHFVCAQGLFGEGLCCRSWCLRSAKSLLVFDWTVVDVHQKRVNIKSAIVMAATMTSCSTAILCKKHTADLGVTV